MVTVETATPDHADGICRVCAASWCDAYDDVLAEEYVEANVRMRYDPERVEGIICDDDPIGEYLVALRSEATETDDGTETVVGVVRDDRPEPEIGEISDLYVHPDWQGEGVGTQLLAALTERQRD